MLNKRFLITLLTFVVIGLGATAAVFLAKGYKFSPEQRTFSGTGILSITSEPDQASVYLDDHLTSATNTNINSLVPKKYKIRIEKERFIPWNKEVDVAEGLVSEVEARLFPAIPTIYPLTYNGIENPVLSADGQKLAFKVPGTEKKSGIWVWDMSERQIAFARGAEPHQIATATRFDFSKAILEWSPDSTQVLITLSDRTLLLDQASLNSEPRDITAILQPTMKQWAEEIKTKDIARIKAVVDSRLRKVASDSAYLRWAPDETKFLHSENYSEQNQTITIQDPAEKVLTKFKFQVTDLVTKKTHDLPEALAAIWLSDSRHLLLVDEDKISVVEFDGGNLAVIYGGSIDEQAVYPWPDGSRVMIITSFPTPTAEQPNLYGIDLK